MSTPKPPKFQRPNPEGAKSKSKIGRAGRILVRIVAKLENRALKFEDTARVMHANGQVYTCALSDISPAKPGDEESFNAQYQRHLRKLDADKIKHPKK